ncbi:MFS transporter [Nocardia jinanensis]|uniref:Proline/betaine transporter n=1 Tax=Nocardia jinanensis TaxID=382504 RepID=A0A917RLL6_9NOCA|nr:MFS transporter [Nocardia jinanensis]GGL13324.1 proline/betaine transporter [Nocardia jinanensis]
MNTGPTSARVARRRAALATIFGCTVEAYDFTVFTYLVIFVAPAFFPDGDPAAAVLSTLLVFAAGFVARPLGGIFFGRLGDRIGRRRTLLITIVLMGVSSVVMGMLPTYSVVGIAAPILLVVARLLQGFSAGGELSGASVYAAEHGTSDNAGRFNTLQPIGFSLGAALAPLVVGITASVLGTETMTQWGWRVPLLLVLPLTLVCLALRTRVAESPAFAALTEQQAGSAAPLREVFARYRGAVLQCICLALVNGLIAYLLIAYLPVYINGAGHLEPGPVSLIFAGVGAVTIPLIFVSGALVDRVGPKRLLCTVLVVVVVLIVPAMAVLRNSSSIVGVALTVLVLLVFTQMIAPPVLATSTGLFPTRIRYSGVAVGYMVGSVLGSGFGPYAAAKLAASTGNPYAPALLVVAAAVLGCVVIVVAKPRYVDIAGEEAKTAGSPSGKGGEALSI